MQHSLAGPTGQGPVRGVCSHTLSITPSETALKQTHMVCPSPGSGCSSCTIHWPPWLMSHHLGLSDPETKPHKHQETCQPTGREDAVYMWAYSNCFSSSHAPIGSFDTTYVAAIHSMLCWWHKAPAAAAVGGSRACYAFGIC